MSTLTGLRQLTRFAHRRLDRDLGLLVRPLSPERFGRFLAGLLGFFQIWEPAVAAIPQVRGFLPGPSRLPVLRADLVALGLSPQEIAAVPACSAAAQVAQSSALALGSLYVVEGSRRGGQVIAQALRDASWLPPQGLTYFDDRSSTGAWHHLAATLDQSLWDQADPEIGGGALLTFEVLRGWLTESVIE